MIASDELPEPDDDGITRVATRDEAIAVAMMQAGDGGEVIAHRAWCEGDGDGVGCTCTPEVIVVRRGAA